MKTGLTIFLKKHLLWILLFGTLIGLNEALIGSFNMPYRSVIINAITISLLAFARLKVPRAGTSLLVICIALLFKLNNLGFHHCTTNVLLCGPTALLMLGVSFEVFASIFISKPATKYFNYALTSVLASVVAFSLFALMNTYILRSWDAGRLIEYIFIKGSMTAVASAIITVLGVYATKRINNIHFFKPYIINSVLGVIIAGLWVFGSLSAFH